MNYIMRLWLLSLEQLYGLPLNRSTASRRAATIACMMIMFQLGLMTGSDSPNPGSCVGESNMAVSCGTVLPSIAMATCAGVAREPGV